VNSEELLVQWCRFGWKYRGIGSRPQAEQDWYAERVRYELQLMLEKNLADFFLATSDMVRWAKDNGIPVGPGRGSVAASVVSWLLRITEVDPHRYPGMLFERFLDVSRADPPDIDLDIADDRRHDLFEYMASKYGSNCVGTIGNFVRYRGKNSLADIARVYNIPIWAKETIGSLLIERSGGDSRFDASLEDTAKLFPAAAAIFEQFPDFWKACRLEGNVRGLSVHAAGMIVANSPLTDICSVYERDGRKILSIDKYDAEYCGALKMDMLGLSTMGMIGRCLEMAGITLEELYAVPDDDPGSLAIFKEGDLTGIFQFEGRATRLVNRDVSPDNFAEIADINALSRPGPLFSGTTAEYCDVKFGRRKPERFHPIVDEVTRDTRGQIVYQEQILRILKEIGGFDWFSVGQIRRIISKKLGEAAFQMSFDKFRTGAENDHGIDAKTADRIWRRLVTSGTYSFNIAHAISYSLLAFWTAYLKSHHPLEFYAASLSHGADEDQQFRLMKDALKHGIEISPPRLGYSRSSWTVHYELEDGKPPRRELVAGWRQIPRIGEVTARKIDALCVDGYFPRTWSDLMAVQGIGPKTAERMEEFATSHDPFGLKRTEVILKRVLEWIRTQQDYVPVPTHNGEEVAGIYVRDNRQTGGKWVTGPRVIYAGIVRERSYQDAVENARSRSGLEVADILATMKRPDLVKYCSLRCYDGTDEEVYLRVNRYKFPQLKSMIDKIAVGHDVVVAVGNRIAGFGTPIAVDKIFVVDPD
jgi:Zierdtviridae DNA polymerase